QYKTSTLRSGWKKLSIEESYGNQVLNTEARHINDGMLRLMAILAQTQTEHSFLLFDEIENGINPELIEQLVNWLIEAPQQILVTTHSPMILNYLEDEQAEKSVILIYKTPEGYTRSKRFFDIPAMKEKLSALGVGEVFIDTDLNALVNEINTAEKV
ncbi:MAG: AAA family ATPase, partial [Methylococcaceae bacterium]|nr:AAA family ATPase [Methylococcaceae bacterium]